ncbi:MAG TPA: alpha/beta fold hydrolase [Burkholderiales bacterium]|nr:alpha/beta fold hydrolase [Burkholderiales bacterium]
MKTNPGEAGSGVNRMEWLLFEQLDRMRRAQGSFCDAVGLGPVETPYETIHREPGVSLRSYGKGARGGPLVLIVPAPIKRPYIWDLDPESSAVRRLLDAGARVMLADWQPASSAFGLAEYADRLLLVCLDAARAERAVLLAHSLGGLLTAIFSTLHPERVQGLGLIAAPLSFGAATPIVNAMLHGLAAEELPDSLPGSFLSSASANAAPDVFGSQRLLDAMLSGGDPARLRTHLLVERWTLDEFALPRRLVAELATHIVRENRFVRGTLEVAGRSAAPTRLTAPLLCVLDRRCRLAPPESVLPFVQAAASRAKTLLDYEGDIGVALQHVGPLVGRNAHALLWPKIVDWIALTAVH